MPYWMTNPEHGTMPAYDLGEVERAKVHGWALLNVGEAPDYSTPVSGAPATASVASAAIPGPSQLQPDKPEVVTNPLDLTVVQILPQFPAMSLPALESMRFEESQGKARKGLLLALDAEIERRRG